jgi:hypothetical protein
VCSAAGRPLLRKGFGALIFWSHSACAVDVSSFNDVCSIPGEAERCRGGQGGNTAEGGGGGGGGGDGEVVVWEGTEMSLSPCSVRAPAGQKRPNIVSKET